MRNNMIYAPTNPIQVPMSIVYIILKRNFFRPPISSFFTTWGDVIMPPPGQR